MAAMTKTVSMSKSSWKLLCSLKSGTPIELLDQDIVVLDNDIYKLSESQYCLAKIPFNSSDGIPRIISMFWACSEKAFRRAYFNEVEGDDLVICKPPHELLPPKSKPTYSQILINLKASSAKVVIECASYRVMSDGAFIHKSIESDLVDYYFRSPDSIEDELPYVILWKMKTN